MKSQKEKKQKLIAIKLKLDTFQDGNMPAVDASALNFQGPYEMMFL